MNDFDYDVMIKKRVANSARNRKRGSKSKKCPMSTDHMTRKQWLERCGETVTYNLSKPMEWQDFCNLPIHIQKEYLLNLIKLYSTTASDLAISVRGSAAGARRSGPGRPGPRRWTAAESGRRSAPRPTPPPAVAAAWPGH